MFSALKESSTGSLLIILLESAHLMFFSLVLRRWDLWEILKGSCSIHITHLHLLDLTLGIRYHWSTFEKDSTFVWLTNDSRYISHFPSHLSETDDYAQSLTLTCTLFMHMINYPCLKMCNFILNGALLMMSEHPSYVQVSFRVKVTRSIPRVSEDERTLTLQEA